MTPVDASTRGRRNRDKGIAFEKSVARAIRPWFPDARRSRDNGSSNTADTGDLADAGPAFFWTLKDDRAGHNSAPGVIAGWYAEALMKGDGRIPVLVQKRPGQGDPLMSWAWISQLDYQLLLARVPAFARSPDALVRMELRDLLAVMAWSNHARSPKEGVA